MEFRDVLESQMSSQSRQLGPFPIPRGWRAIRKSSDQILSFLFADPPGVGSTVVASPLLLVLTSLVRKGRIRSAERTEVHLIQTTSCHELTFCP